MAEYEGDKTELPTAKRRKDAVEQGDVLKSREFATALIVLAGCGWLALFGQSLVRACEGIMTASFRFGRGDIEDWSPMKPLAQAGLEAGARDRQPVPDRDGGGDLQPGRARLVPLQRHAAPAQILAGEPGIGAQADLRSDRLDRARQVAAQGHPARRDRRVAAVAHGAPDDGAGLVRRRRGRGQRSCRGRSSRSCS